MNIHAIRPGSVAERVGLRAGDRVQGVNGEPVRDSLDFLFLAADDDLVLDVRGAEGARRVHVRRRPGEDLGLEVEPDLLRRCANRCPFCFVDQLPPGLRPSLYVKDEDYRLSFLHGAYVTLTNLTRTDWRRIAEQRLSPLYVSVHSTEPAVRASLLGNPKAADILGALRRLAGMRIRVHAQVVVCPGMNDGAHLARTVDDLLSLHPWVESVALVPVGLTRHRAGLPALEGCTASLAADLIRDVEAWQGRSLRERGTRGVFLADEFYLLAGGALPPREAYESLAQVENGVGMTSVFLEEVQAALQTVASERVRRTRALFVTGTLAAPILERALAAPLRRAGGDCRVVPVRNRLLGESVTVSGLLSREDIRDAVRGEDPSLRVFLPPNCVSVDGLFLDGGVPEDLARELGMDVRVASEDTARFVEDLVPAAEARP